MIIKLELDLNHVNLLLRVLTELPYKTSAPVIQEIEKQTHAQVPKDKSE